MWKLKRNMRLGRRRRTIVLNVDVARRRRSRGPAGDGAGERRRAWPALMLAAGAAAFLCAVGGTGLARKALQPPGFTLRWIEVSNEALLSRSEIVSLAGVRIGDNLLTASLGRIRERLCAHPDIREAVVRRRVPGTILIRVYERMPLAAVYCPPPGSHGEGSPPQRRVLDEEGVVLSWRKERSNRALPMLMGLRVGALHAGDRLCSPAAKRALAVVKQCRESELCRQLDLVAVDVSDPANCVIRSPSIQEIRLGNENIADRLRLLSYILKHRASRGLDAPASYIDLRWRDIAELPLRTDVASMK
jgi:cell division septal protein FtsQ